ncbi:MAG: CYTH domain-containing protein [Patescibacteria group bacterium]|nr:hypothetical protein [Patescibacteria group bacterium]
MKIKKELEIEKTYLIKYIPKDLFKYRSKDIEDLYIPKEAKHARLRIRKNGDYFVITKKIPVKNENASFHSEFNLEITEQEFNALHGSNCNTIKKTRFYYPYQKMVAEIDIFKGRHKGLVLVDFEFKNKSELIKFEAPDFCLADVTEEDFTAGGVLCKNSFSKLSPYLKKFNYKKV